MSYYFEDLNRELVDFFLPFYVSPRDNLVLARILMHLASVNTSAHKPTHCHFGSSTQNRFYLEIGNLNEKESQQILQLFKSVGDCDAIKDEAYYNRMEEIRHYQSFRYLLSGEIFIHKILPRIKEYMHHISASELNDFRLASKNDHLVIIYKRVIEMCDQLTNIAECYKHKKEFNVAPILHQTRNALLKYKSDDFHLHDACNDLYELFTKYPTLKSDINFSSLRDKIFEHCNYVNPIQVIFRYAPPAPEPSNADAPKKSRCKALQFFKNVTHPLEEKVKTIFTCGHR